MILASISAIIKLLSIYQNSEYNPWYLTDAQWIFVTVVVIIIIIILLELLYSRDPRKKLTIATATCSTGKNDQELYQTFYFRYDSVSSTANII